MSEQKPPEVPRRAQARIAALQAQFRAVVVNGARQSGKTTVMLQMPDGTGPYLSLDDDTDLSSGERGSEATSMLSLRETYAK